MNTSTRSTVKAPQSTLPGPDDITRTILPNGIVLLTHPNFNSPSVVIGGYLQCGSLFDPDEKLGLANFTAMALTRGTHRRRFHRISNVLESVGASLHFSAGIHTTGFTGRALAEDLPLLLEILIEVLSQPSFPSQQVENLRTELLTSLAIRAQDTADMASLTFDQLLFAGHPYARPEDGLPETIQTITRKDLKEFHNTTYGPRGMTLAVVGAIEPLAVVDRVAKALDSWQNPHQPDIPTLPPLRSVKRTVSRKVNILGKSQTDIVIGAYGPQRKDPDFVPASLGNSILGQLGLAGRIGKVVREKSGLAYYAHSSLNAWIGPGSWQVSAGVNPANVTRACDLIRREIRRFVEENVSLVELADSQSNFIGRLPLSLESNAGVVHALLNIERFDLGLDYFRCYPEQIRSVMPDDILTAARKYLHPNRLITAIAGP